MTGISDLFAIGASGARAYRAAMGAVSENITNATTDGYNRRVVRLGESPSSSATSQFYQPGVAFGGVDVKGIARNNDEYLDLASRIATSNFESADARDTWLSNVQTALDDGSLGIGSKLTTMFSAAERLASNPTDTTLRTNLLFAFEQVNSSFKQSYNELQNVKAGVTAEAGNEVVALNDAATRLASVNEALRRAQPGSSNAAQLLDERDMALSDIAKRIDATVTFRENGAADVTYNGALLVDNIVPKAFTVTADAAGKLSFTLDGTATTVPQSGSLSGLAASADVLASRVDSINALAVQYVSDVNTWHKAGYTTLTPTPVAGGDMVSGTSAADLAVVITNTADIAATSADGRINGNLVAISNIRGTTGVENGWTSIISAHANLLSATKAEQSATSLRNQQALNARADVSGVDLDREAADLMRLQQAYEGSARIIQVAKENIQTIFSIF